MSQKITIRRRSKFSTIPNAVIRDTSISAEARLMLCYIMSCSEDWVFYRAKSMEILGCKKDKYQKIIRELKAAGYLVIHVKRKPDGRLDGYTWEVFDEPNVPDTGEQGENEAQHVDLEASHREPEKPAPGEGEAGPDHRGPEKPARRLNPPAGKTGPLRIPIKEKEKLSSCAASPAHRSDLDFDVFFRSFQDAYPRLGDLSAVEAGLRAALEAGDDPKLILAGAHKYAAEQKGNKTQYIAYAANWLRDRRWEQYGAAAEPKHDRQEVLDYWANVISEASPAMKGRVSSEMARECLAAELVTPDQCRVMGVSI